jgi:hypothetical protein
VPPRYPEVDSISYDATSKACAQLVSLIAAVLDDERADLVLFFSRRSNSRWRFWMRIGGMKPAASLAPCSVTV